MLVDNGDTYSMRQSFVDGLFKLFKNTTEPNKPLIVKYKGEWLILNGKDTPYAQYQKVHKLVKYLNSGYATREEYEEQVNLAAAKSRFWDMIP